ncbi:MAG: alpha/beta fold hydrolase [Pseudomonadota bacterium]
MYSTATGDGPPLILVHGLGSNGETWRGILPALAVGRRVIAIDLPGHGRSPAEHDSATFDGLARSLEAFLVEQDFARADLVGSSLGGRLVLEMARRGRAGSVVALDPGGFWQGWERTFLRTTLQASGALLRGLHGMRAVMARNPATRTMLLAQLSAHPWKLDGDTVAAELESLATTKTFSGLVNNLATAPMQSGPAAWEDCRIAVGWGRHDRLCLPVQAARAMAAFPNARLHWFEHSGHFPHWDEPDATVRLIRETTAG